MITLFVHKKIMCSRPHHVDANETTTKTDNVSPLYWHGQTFRKLKQQILFTSNWNTTLINYSCSLISSLLCFSDFSLENRATQFQMIITVRYTDTMNLAPILAPRTRFEWFFEPYYNLVLIKTIYTVLYAFVQSLYTSKLLFPLSFNIIYS